LTARPTWEQLVAPGDTIAAELGEIERFALSHRSARHYFISTWG